MSSSADKRVSGVLERKENSRVRVWGTEPWYNGELKVTQFHWSEIYSAMWQGPDNEELSKEVYTVQPRPFEFRVQRVKTPPCTVLRQIDF